MSRTNFHSPEDVRAIEVLLYTVRVYLTYIAAKLLRSARRSPPFNHLAKYYVKFGGSLQAKRDFKALNPSNVEHVEVRDEVCIVYNTIWIGAIFHEMYVKL